MRRLRIESNGKRGSIEIQLVDGAVVTSTIEGVSFERVEGVRQSFRSLDDVSVELVLEPLEARAVRVESAEIDFWCDGEDPAEYLQAMVGEATTVRAAFDFRVALRVID